MTEEEAKEKWCPFTRFKFAATSDNPSSNREGGPEGGSNPWLLAGTRCIGSNCMAWRVSKWAYFDKFNRPSDYSNDAVKKIALQGFCGLAGEPK